MSNNDLNKAIYAELCKAFDEQWYRFGECPQCRIDEVREGIEFAEDFDKNEDNRRQYGLMADLYHSRDFNIRCGSFKCSFYVAQLPRLMRRFRSLSRTIDKHRIPELTSRFLNI